RRRRRKRPRAKAEAGHPPARDQARTEARSQTVQGATRAPSRKPARTDSQDAPSVVARIRELEAQLDRLIDEASRRDLDKLAPEDDESDPAPSTSDLDITRDALPEDVDPPRGTDGSAWQPPPVPPSERNDRLEPVALPRPSTPDRLSASQLPGETTVF